MDWARKGPHRGEDLFYVNQLCSTACTREISKGPYFWCQRSGQNRIKEIGADKVTNSTIGVMLDNDGNFVVLPTVAKVYHSLSDAELFRYAPINRTPGIPGSCPGCLFWPVPSGWLLHGCSWQPLAAAVPSITASGTTRCLVIRCLQALGIGALTRPCAAI